MTALRSLVCLLTVVAVGEASPLRVLGPDGRPAAGADVRVSAPAQGRLAALLPFAASGVTDDRGVVDLAVPLLRGAVMTVDHPDFAPAVIAVGGGGPIGDLRLEAGRSWSGRVQAPGAAPLPAGGRACLAGVLGTAPGDGRRWRRCGAVATDGTVTVTGLGRPPWRLTVTVPGFLAAGADATPDGTPAVVLRPGVTLRGAVTDERGEALAGVAVSAGGEATTSGDDGAFALAVPRLPCPLTFAKESFLEGRVEVADPERPITVALASAPAVTATLLTPDGPFSGKVGVWYRREAGPGEPNALASRDAAVTRGALAVPLPAAGSYSVVLRPQGYQEVRAGTLVVGPGQRFPLGTIALERGCGVSGEVMHEATGEPIAGALVEAVPVGSTVFALALARTMPAAVSDVQGRFVLGGLRPGRYLVRLRRADLAPAYRVVTVTALVDLGRLPLGAGVVLGGRTTALGGSPQTGIEVRVLDPAREAIEPFASATSDDDGRYRLPALGPGRYRVELWRGRLLRVREVVLTRGQPAATADFEVGGVTLRGLVLSGGLAATGGTVYLASGLDRGRTQPRLTVRYGADTIDLGVPASRVSAAVGADGSFTAADAPSGAVWLTYDSGRSTATLRLQVADEPEVTLPVPLPDATVRGRVADPSGRGLDATVSLLDGELGREVAYAQADADGGFTLEHAATGSYRLVVTRDGYAPAVVDGVAVPREEPLPPVVLTPGEGGRISVELLRPDRSPAAFVPVSIFAADGRFVLGAFTMDGGTAALPPLPTGEYVAAWADPLAGAGADAPVRLARDNVVVLRPGLADAGSSLTISCPLVECAGLPVESLSVKGSRGPDLTPLLSGVTPELAFGEDGVISLGRIAPGRYTVTLGVDGKRYTKDVNARGDTVQATF